MESQAELVNLKRSPGIDFNESIPLAYVAWRAGTITPFLLGFSSTIGGRNRFFDIDF